MRPETAYYRIRVALNDYVYTGRCARLNKCLPELYKLAEPSRWSDGEEKVYWEEYCVQDYTPIKIHVKILHMSDRFNAPHRLAYLIKGVEEGRFHDRLG